jgi:hypothetical protein
MRHKDKTLLSNLTAAANLKVSLTHKVATHLLKEEGNTND